MLGEKTWTHSICDECWLKREPNRQPVKGTQRDWEMCCWCGKTHDSGIYCREDQTKLLCGQIDYMTNKMARLILYSFEDTEEFSELTVREQEIVGNEQSYRLLMSWAHLVVRGKLDDDEGE